MKALWIFFILIVFCIYVLFGLYITEGIVLLPQLILTWVIYTILWTTFLNVFILGYFWSVVRTKQGPTGLRGPSGEKGGFGIQGQCSISSSQAYLIQALTQYIDDLYTSKGNKSILDKDTQKFPNTYLNTRLQSMAGSRQYQVIVGNLSNENKPIENIVNYLKSIWKEWFVLLYNATDPPGLWFTDEFGDEKTIWTGASPFDEIQKYDVYYWGITRNFRPLKAEICRSSSTYESSKMPNKPKTEARLKVINSNDYRFIRNDRGSRGNGQHNSGNINWWEAKPVEYDGNTYYPVGQIIQSIDGYGSYSSKSSGITRVGDFQYNSGGTVNGPDRTTILVAGDVVEPEYQLIDHDNGVYQYWGKAPKGYVCMGDSISGGNIRCVPEDCVEEITNGTLKRGWTNYYNDRIQYVLENPNHNEGRDGNAENAYYNFRVNYQRPFYRLKKSCLEGSKNSTPSTKDVEKEFSKLGIGWNGHPYKLEPRYSIFSFLNLVPEGIIVHKGSGRRFYIIHYGGEETNIYNVLSYNARADKFQNALQTNDDNNINKSNSISNFEDQPDTSTSTPILNTYTLSHPNGKTILYDNNTNILSLNKGNELFVDISYNLNDQVTDNDNENDNNKKIANNITSAFCKIDDKKVIADKFIKNHKDTIWYINENEDGLAKIYNNNDKYIGYDEDSDNITIVTSDDPRIVSWNINYISE